MTRPDDHRRPGPPRLDRKSAARRHGRVALAALALALMSAACGSGDSDDESGGVVVRDISVDTVDGTDITATEPADDAGSSAVEDEENTPAEPDDEPTATTLPQAGDSSPQEDVFAAVEVFQSCMTAEGTEFIGPPDASLGADAPQNQQPYIDSLILCATRSDIQNKIAAAQAAQAALTPEEVEEQNRSFLLFRDCMIGRGWGMPDPVPNESGLLFSLAQTSEWEAPAGEELIDSDDVAECQDEVAAEDS